MTSAFKYYDAWPITKGWPCALRVVHAVLCYHAVLCCAAWRRAEMCNWLSYCTIPYHTIPYHTIPYHTIPYHTIPYHTIPYHTIPYHVLLCCAVLCCAVLCCAVFSNWLPWTPCYAVLCQIVSSLTSLLSSLHPREGGPFQAMLPTLFRVQEENQG